MYIYIYISSTVSGSFGVQELGLQGSQVSRGGCSVQVMKRVGLGDQNLLV